MIINFVDHSLFSHYGFNGLCSTCYRFTCQFSTKPVQSCSAAVSNLYLFPGSMFEGMEGEHGLTGLGSALTCGSVTSRGRRGVVVVVVVVVRQAAVGAVSRGFLVMQRHCVPQLPSAFLQQNLLRFVRHIAVGNQRYRVVIFDVADVGFIAIGGRSVQHVSEVAKT